MKKACVGFIILALLVVTGCGESAPVVSSTAPMLTPGNSATPVLSETPIPTPIPVPDVVTLTVYEGGEYLRDVTLEEEADYKVVTDAVAEASLSATALPAVDMAEQPDYIQIYVGYTDDEVFEYYAFELDGSCCLQGIDAETYSAISEETYAALRALTEA